MSQLKYLIEKEFKQIWRNAIIPKMIVIYPVLVLLIFPWAIDFEIKNISVHVVDNSKSAYSQRLINKIEVSAYFVLSDVSNDHKRAIGDVKDSRTDVVLEIPASFDRDIVKLQHAVVMISANAVNSTQGLLGSNYLTQIVNGFSDELRTEIHPASLLTNDSHIEIVPDYRYNSKLNYKIFMLPAFIVLMLTLLCGILPSLNIVIEKETGTIQQINATPVSKFNFILAKLIPYWIIGLIIVTISFVLVWLIYGLFPVGSFLTLYVATVIFILGITGMSIIISNYSSTLQQASFLVMFFILIIIMLSGIFTPVLAMPVWAQIIAYINPLTYFIEIMRLVYLKGSSLTDILVPLLCLVGFAIGFNIWAVIGYRKRG